MEIRDVTIKRFDIVGITEEEMLILAECLGNMSTGIIVEKLKTHGLPEIDGIYAIHNRLYDRVAQAVGLD